MVMPKINYVVLFIISFIGLSFFWFSASENAVLITGRVIGDNSNNQEINEITQVEAEQIVLDYINSININGNIEYIRKEGDEWSIKFNVYKGINLIFYLNNTGDIKCFEIDRKKECYDNFDNLNQELLEKIVSFNNLIDVTKL